MEAIQMVDLLTQYQKIQEEIDAAILDVVRSGKYINGKPVETFAGQLAEYTGARYAIPCGNGTDALQIALMALDLQPGDEVIVPAFTYPAAVETVALLKLKPVVVDIDPLTFNIAPEKILDAISPQTKAIIPTHLFGLCSNMETILKIAEQNKLYVIEDNAQSIGSTYTFSNGEKKQSGTMGIIGTLSFFPTKNLGCYGDGGALLTNNENLAQKIKMITIHGQSQKYLHQMIGCNSRLDNLQAAVLSVKLKYLNEYIQARQTSADLYRKMSANLPVWIEMPGCPAYSTHVYNQFTLKIKERNKGTGNTRDELKSHLQKAGIPTTVYYPFPVHEQPAFKSVIRKGSTLTESEELCKSVLSLPMHTELKREQIQYITEQLIQYE
jgi:dTDP-4-amino-4,6-dideoxygalactose transaminase